MLDVESRFADYSEDFPKPRQVFVTHSHALVTKVKERFKMLYESIKSVSCSPKELKLLAQTKVATRAETDPLLFETWPSDLPRRFSDLNDEHFPLFVAYDHVCLMESFHRSVPDIFLDKAMHHDPP